jgi:foldase protein PrsA
VKRIVRFPLALGAIFVAVVAVSACGSAIPGNSVAVVAGVPITNQTLAHWGYVAAVGEAESSPGSPVIVPDPPKYTKCIAALKKIAPSTYPTSELKTACESQFAQTMEYLVRSYWVQGQAAKEGVKVTSKAVNAKYTTAKAQEFKTAAQFKTFLSETGQTVNDILYRFRISLLATKLATPAAVKAYYKAHLSSYSTPEKRNVRIILTKTASQAAAAKAALQSGHTWAATAKQYSTDAATKNIGGLLKGVVNGEEPTALNAAIFSAPHLKLLGPIKSPFGYYVAEVTDIMPATTDSLAKETSTITSTLTQDALSAPPWEKTWKAKTTCRAGFEIPDCSNYTAPKTTSTTTPAGTATTTTPSTTTTPTPSTTTTPTPTTTTTTAK